MEAPSAAAASSDSSALAPTHLDREMFKETVHLLALRIPQKLTGPMLGRLGGSKQASYLFCRPRVKVVVPDERKGQDFKKILLKESIKDSTLSELPSELRNYVLQNAEVTKHTLQLGYAHLSSDDVLSRLLPSGIPVPSSFETVGHIAHLNLHDCHMPYRHLIGQVIIDKNPRIRTVVNKTNNISAVYRTFAMEVIAGENNLDTEVSESKCLFRFNYGEVYWNSRLQAEHNRLISQFTRKDIVCDMFAGVGPFAVPAAKNKGCIVYANDLNPKSYQALVANAALNKVSNRIHCYNMDAREFVRFLVSNKSNQPFTQVVMNLPASAEHFLDVFKTFPHHLPSPTVHCYMFTAAPDLTADVLKRVEEILERPLPEDTQVHEVRDVSPHKRMMCVTFRLPYGSNPSSPLSLLPATATDNKKEERGVKRKPKEQRPQAARKKQGGEEEEEEGEEEAEDEQEEKEKEKEKEKGSEGMPSLSKRPRSA